MRKILNKLKILLPYEFRKDYVESYDIATDLTIHTKAPSKWLLIDMETGQFYIGSKEPNEYGKWIRVRDKNIDYGTLAWYNGSMISQPPCFYCEDPALYSGEVAAIEGKMEIVDVCKKHLTLQEASS